MTYPFMVLIVDPDEDTRHIAKAVFAHLGHRAIAVETGVEGLRLADTLRPDVMVVDLVVPPWSAEQLLSRLRGSHRTRRIPVIAFTARAGLKDRERLMACGFEDVVLKPCEPRALAIIVEHVLRQGDVDPRSHADVGRSKRPVSVPSSASANALHGPCSPSNSASSVTSRDRTQPVTKSDQFPRSVVTRGGHRLDTHEPPSTELLR